MLKQIQLLFSPQQQVCARRPKRPSVRISDDFLYRLWIDLRSNYFPDRADLDDYLVTWSTRRQRRVLASCNIRRRKVVVAQELYQPGASQWISPVLYHELCHAVLGESIVTPEGRRLWHGAQFRALEARHPDIPAMNAWIASGGWALAVRSHRAKAAWAQRRGTDLRPKEHTG